MDDAKNFLLGLMQTVRERFGNPLISAFAIAWTIWNFRLILVLVGSGEGGWQAKITYIDTRLMVHWWQWLLHGMAIPLASALAWIYALPPLLRRVAGDHERSQNRTREAIFLVTEARTLSAEEALRLREVTVKQRIEWREEKAAIVQSLENYEVAQKAAAEQLTEAKRTNQERLRQIEKFEGEIELLRNPPREHFDFKGKRTIDKANALGVKLDDLSPETETGSVNFDGKSVLWPWNPTESQKFDIKYPRLVEAPIYDKTLAALFFLAKVHAGKSTPQPRTAWIGILRSQNFESPGSLFQSLWIHGVLTGNYTAPEFRTEMVQAAEWLRSVGFELVTANRSTLQRNS